MTSVGLFSGRPVKMGSSGKSVSLLIKGNKENLTASQYKLLHIILNLNINKNLLLT